MMGKYKTKKKTTTKYEIKTDNNVQSRIRFCLLSLVLVISIFHVLLPLSVLLISYMDP